MSGHFTDFSNTEYEDYCDNYMEYVNTGEAENKRAERIKRLQAQYPTWERDRIEQYIDLRDEGYSSYQAQLMAGLCDPV
jgi:hypothetical protein